MTPGFFGQSIAIGDLQDDVEWLRSQTRRRIALKANRSEVEHLQEEIDHLRLYIATLFRILIARRIMTLEETRKLLVRIDAEDGQIDGAYPENRDPVTGQEQPPQTNPFAGLGP
jgi:hypothetical protein